MGESRVEEWTELEHVRRLEGEEIRERRNQVQQPGGPKVHTQWASNKNVWII